MDTPGTAGAVPGKRDALAGIFRPASAAADTTDPPD
jgi:hypothetical protein